MDDYFLEWLIGAIVWTFANVLYVDLRRKGEQKGRIISFIVGYPGTLISLFAVREGRVPRIGPPEDDDGRLLREIRVDRELREGDGGRRTHRRPDEVAREGPEAPPEI